MINKQPQITFVFNRRKNTSLTVKSAVEMRITYDYKQKYIATGVMLYLNQWKKGKIVNCPDILQISNTLDKMLTEVRQIILDMMNEGDIDIFSIVGRLNQKRKNISFIDYCHQRFNIRKYGKAARSIDRYNLFLKVLKEWGGIRRFKDITELNLIAFDNYLASKGMCIIVRKELSPISRSHLNPLAEVFFCRYRNVCQRMPTRGISILSAYSRKSLRERKKPPACHGKCRAVARPPLVRACRANLGALGVNELDGVSIFFGRLAKHLLEGFVEMSRAVKTATNHNLFNC